MLIRHDLQGDAISGRLSRRDVAAVVSAALKRPYATNTTFEARRTQRRTVGGAATFDEDAQTQEFLKLSQGAHTVLSSSPHLCCPAFLTFERVGH